MRDSPSDWHRSVLRTTQKASKALASFLPGDSPSVSNLLKRWLAPKLPFARFYVKFLEALNSERSGVDGEQVYQQHNELVRRLARSKDFLEYNVKDGWEPLCKFLGKPIPEGEPFPRLNEMAEFEKRLAKMTKMLLLGYSINILKYTGAVIVAVYSMHLAVGKCV